MTDDERRRFAVPAMTGELDGVDNERLDPDDPDDRHIVVLAEHSELGSAAR